MKYYFDEELIEAVIIKRNSQFTVEAMIDGKIEKVHCPTTGRIGNIDLKNVAGLLSKSNNPNRKTKYTLEAISVSKLDVKNKRWVGINQIASNKYIEYFIENNQLSKIAGNSEDIRREVKLGNSKLDIKVDDTYIEIKTPLQTLQIDYDSDIKTKKVTKFSSTTRFIKHINELTDSLKENERAILINTFQYDNPGYEIINKSTNFEEVKSNVEQCINKGIEIWQVNMKIDEKGVELIRYWNITNKFTSD